VKQFVNLLSKASRLHQMQPGSSVGSQSSQGSTGSQYNSINLISVPPKGNPSVPPPQYFTATVGMKPTEAENYLHSTENVRWVVVVAAAAAAAAAALPSLLSCW
jgi:hypothetical protein